MAGVRRKYAVLVDHVHDPNQGVQAVFISADLDKDDTSRILLDATSGVSVGDLIIVRRTGRKHLSWPIWELVEEDTADA